MELSYLITVIAGGTGSVKLVRGLESRIGAKNLNVISNVGDNIWIHGLYVCPDIDTVVYGLAGMLDRKKGWGVKNDSFNFLSQMDRAGKETWFKLGDRDLATHIIRTNMLRKGQDLYQVTREIKASYNIPDAIDIIPATNDPVATTIVTGKAARMHLQEFWVKHAGHPSVVDIVFEGIERARPNPAAIDAIKNSSKIIVAPGNPITSIGPIVAMKEIRDILAKERRKVIAVSPIIGKAAITGPAIKYMKALKMDNSAYGVADYYRDFAGRFIISAKDDNRMEHKIQNLGIKVHKTNIIMKNKRQEESLAGYLLEIQDD